MKIEDSEGEAQSVVAIAFNSCPVEEKGIENILFHFMNWKEDLRTSVKLFVSSPIHNYIQNFHALPKRDW